MTQVSENLRRILNEDKTGLSSDRPSVFLDNIMSLFRRLRMSISELTRETFVNNAKIPADQAPEADFDKILREYMKLFSNLCEQEGVKGVSEYDNRLGISFFYDCHSRAVNPEKLYKYFNVFLGFLKKNRKYGTFRDCVIAMLISRDYLMDREALDPYSYFQTLNIALMMEEFYPHEEE